MRSTVILANLLRLLIIKSRVSGINKNHLNNSFSEKKNSMENSSSVIRFCVAQRRISRGMENGIVLNHKYLLLRNSLMPKVINSVSLVSCSFIFDTEQRIGYRNAEKLKQSQRTSIILLNNDISAHFFCLSLVIHFFFFLVGIFSTILSEQQS